MPTRHLTGVAAAALCSAAGFAGGWVDLIDQTDDRLISGFFPGAVNHAIDTEEKDYIWGDLDGDCDIDLVVVRKEPFTTEGKRTNALLMNEDGVLVDRTFQFASASDVPGDLGFRTPTNDRDVWLADVDLDGDLDIITATTLSDGDPDHLKHPRIYVNQLVEDGGDPTRCGPANAALWTGFIYEAARINDSGLVCGDGTAGPRFCSVAAGDVTGDGYPDLYFGDYDVSVLGGTQLCDFNNRLLVNQGAANPGYFTDETTSRLTAPMTASAFGAASVIADMNGDGVADVVKHTALIDPYQVALTYNNPLNEGFFNGYVEVYNAAPYFVNVGDLNGDGKPDLVVTDDAEDRYLIQTGLNGLNEVQFSPQLFPDSNGFGSNSIIADLNNDGWNDVIVADVDVDVPGCGNRMLMQRNLGGIPGGIPTFDEDNTLPIQAQIGIHDVAVFDIDGDGWNDLVVGRCTGTEVYINDPPSGLLFNYQTGLPQFVDPDTDTIILAKVVPAGPDTTHAEDTGKVFISINGGGFSASDMTYVGNDGYHATLPGQPCTTQYDYYFQVDATDGTHSTDPPDAPANTFTTIAALGVDIEHHQFEDAQEPTGWQVVNTPGDPGGWERVDPHGTFYFGDAAAPEDDATAGGENVKAYVTGNGPDNDPDAAIADVDGGPHRLISPAFDLAGSDAVISYARWFFTAAGVADLLTTEISGDDGESWSTVHATGTTDGWETIEFVVGDHVQPSSSVRVRFSTADAPNDSVTEAGIDDVEIRRLVCTDAPPCATDTDGNGVTDVDDLVAVIVDWSTDGSASNGDVDGSGIVDVDDLVAVILAWGPC